MEEEGLMPFIIGNQNNRIFKKPYSYQYDVYYTEDMGSPSDYLEDFELYSTASPEDIVRIHINSQGGRLDTLVQTVNHIKNSEATTVGILEGEANSAAGALFLQCSAWAVGEDCSLMIHEPTFGSMDSANKVYKHVDFVRDQSRKLYHKYYKYFLSEEEIEKVLNGGDIWMDSDEVLARLKVKKQKLEEEQNETIEN